MVRFVILILGLLPILVIPAAAQDSFPVLPPCQFSDPAQGIDIGALVIDLETGAGCMENPEKVYPIASVPKVFVLGTLLEAVAYEVESFDRELVFTADYLMDGRDACLTRSDVGKVFTLGYLSDTMISCSDNAATWMIMDLLGWYTVQDYIDRLGIDGIGPVIPYSEVDRLKLTLLDERWANVPRSLASQYWRRRRTTGLVPDYFEFAPWYSRDQRRDATLQYFETTNYNTATPRAIADYLLYMRDQLASEDPRQAQAAYWFFNTLLLTQRQYSTQAMPGTVYVGAKNGYDTGVRAEANIMLHNLDTRAPSALAIVFAWQPDAETISSGRDNTPLTDYLRTLSPFIVGWLYPDSTRPPLQQSDRLQTVVVNNTTPINDCWRSYANNAYAEVQIDSLERCWLNLPPPESIPVRQPFGIGLVLRGLNDEPLRLTFIYTRPNGTRISYQTERLNPGQQNTAVYWYHTPDVRGDWQVDIYEDLARVRSLTVTVE